MPVQFFDAPFRIEEAPESASAIGSLRDRNLISARIPQPFSIIENGEAISGGDDLLVALRDDLNKGREPRLRLVIGTAGAGKSLLFKSLFTLMYERFIREKAKTLSFPRPVPLVPEYMHDVYSFRTRELISAFLRSDVASPVTPETFEWMLVNGYCSWFFDGLDELYAGDTEFFDYILDLLTRPGSEARILICARDSLLTTNEAFYRFLEEFPPGAEGSVQVCRLDDWKKNSKRALAWLRTEGRTPKDQETDTHTISTFLGTVSKSEALENITRVPYYCDLILQSFQEDGKLDFEDDFAVLEHAISNLVEREKQKGLLSENYFEQGGFDEWLKTVGVEAYNSNFTGFSRNDLEQYAALVLRNELSSEERNHALISLIQFPLFAPGLRLGTVNFKHELIAEYLAAKYLNDLLVSDPKKVAQQLGGKSDIAGSLICHYLAANIRSDENTINNIFAVLKKGDLVGGGFASLLQILVSAHPDRSLFQKDKDLFESRDLRGIQLQHLDLRDVSFRQCDLSNALFQDCDLQNSKFEGATLIQTRFTDLDAQALIGASFGDLTQFESIIAGNARYDDRNRVKRWIGDVTGTPIEIDDPCSSAQQLRSLFLKFVRPDGTGRRNTLPERALLRGRRYPGAPRPDTLIKQTQHVGYLEAANYRGQISRVPGGAYDDIVDYVRFWKLSEKMRRLLDDVCPITNCRHIPFAH